MATVTIQDITVGTGDEAVDNKIVTVSYTGFVSGGGSLPDVELAGALASDETMDVPVNGMMMIDGWNQGILGMKVGGQRRITVPPELAYGSGPNGGNGEIVPSGATLIFVINLFAVKAVPNL